MIFSACSDHKTPAKAIDAPIDVPVAMECTTCNPATQYCYQIAAGLVAAAPNVGCNAMPAPCASNLTCSCLMANTTTTCGQYVMCTGEGSLLTLTCALP